MLNAFISFRVTHYSVIMNFPFVSAVIFLDLDGNRVAAKFYSPALSRKESQEPLEKQLHDKLKSMTSKSEGIYWLCIGLRIISSRCYVHSRHDLRVQDFQRCPSFSIGVL